MKKIKIIILLLWCSYAYSQNEIDIITGASYLSETYYDLETGESLEVSRIEWDIAFNTDAESGSVLANNGNELKVYVYPLGDTSAWMNIDTMGIENWKPLYNSLDSWDIGAFNRNKSVENDFGWGVFYPDENKIKGDSLYILKYLMGQYKVLWIKEKDLSNNTWKVCHSNIDGSNKIEIEIDAKICMSKHMVHYSLLNNIIMMHEPDKEGWDLYFHLFFDYTIHSKVNGVWQNRHIAVQQVDGVDQNSFCNYAEASFSSVPSTIGGDWKEYNWIDAQYEVSDNTVFFVKDTTQPWTSPLYKIYFTYFGGMTDGNYSFILEKIEPTGIVPMQLYSAAVYPNPSKSQVQIVHDLKGTGTLKIINTSGRVVKKIKVSNNSYLNKQILNISELTQGVYFCVLETEKGRASARFVKSE